MMLTPVSVVSHDQKKSCFISFRSSWPNTCNGAIYSAIHIIWCQCQWCHMTECHVALHFNHLDLMNAMLPSSYDEISHVAPLFSCLDVMNTMLSLMTLLALVMLSMSCNANTATNGVTWPKKSCCISFWFFVDLTNPMVQFMTLWASCDVIASISSVAWPEGHVVSHFDHLDLANAVVPLMMLLGSYGANALCQWSCMAQKLCFALFWESWSDKCSGAIENAVLRKIVIM